MLKTVGSSTRPFISDYIRARHKACPIKNVLEIGPLDKPFISKLLKKASIKYLDHATRSDLIRKYGDTVDSASIPEIDFVFDGYRPYSDICGLGYDLVFSSHCLEHQPNLLGHLNEVSEILANGGMYVCFIPDFRYCFDSLRPPSTIIDILLEFYSSPSRPSTRSILEHLFVSSGTSNDSIAHQKSWRDMSRDQYIDKLTDVTCSNALRLLNKAKEIINSNVYHDCHVWKLYPLGMSRILETIISCGLLGFKSFSVFQSSDHMKKYEFALVLKAGEDELFTHS